MVAKWDRRMREKKAPLYRASMAVWDQLLPRERGKGGTVADSESRKKLGAKLGASRAQLMHRSWY